MLQNLPECIFCPLENEDFVTDSLKLKLEKIECFFTGVKTGLEREIAIRANPPRRYFCNKHFAQAGLFCDVSSVNELSDTKDILTPNAELILFSQKCNMKFVLCHGRKSI